MHNESSSSATAKFVFHGLYPDVVKQDEKEKQIARVLFDVEFNHEFHSHLTADIEVVEENGEMFFDVRYRIPFQCADFPQAAIQYYQFISGPQQRTVSHSGPKGASIATHNVVRAEWPVELPAKVSD